MMHGLLLQERNCKNLQPHQQTRRFRVKGFYSLTDSNQHARVCLAWQNLQFCIVTSFYLVQSFHAGVIKFSFSQDTILVTYPLKLAGPLERHCPKTQKRNTKAKLPRILKIDSNATFFKRNNRRVVNLHLRVETKKCQCPIHSIIRS